MSHDLNHAHGTVTGGVSGGWGGAPNNTSNANDDDHDTNSRHSSFAMGAGTAVWWWQTDLGSAYEVSSHEVYQPTATYAWQSAWDTYIEGSADGTAWATAAYSLSTATYNNNGVGGGVKSAFVYTLDTPATYRYWRIRKTFTAAGFQFVDHDALAEWIINEATGAPAADFTATPTSGNAPLEVAFTDTSGGTPTAWSWDFGDGSAAGTAQNPTHTYTVPGSYTVSLAASNANGTATETKLNYITVTSAGVVIGDPSDEVAVLPASDIISWNIQRGAGGMAVVGSYTGSATVRLKNRDNRYNPANSESDIIDLLRDGTRIWLGVNDDGTLAEDESKTVYGLFGGRITDITPEIVPGMDTPPTVEIVCEDPLAWLHRTPVTVAGSRHRSHKELRQAILTAAGETNLDLAEEVATMPFSDADGFAGALLEELNAATGSRHFARPANNPGDWYEYVSVNRMHGLSGVAAATANAAAQHVTGTSGWRTSADTVINQQRVTVEPVHFTSLQTTVWESEDVPFHVTRVPKAASTRREIWVEFDNYVDSPTLLINASSGTVTGTLTPFGRTAKITFGGTGVVSALEIQGALAKVGAAESVLVDDETSQEPPRGVRTGSDIGGDYVGTIQSAQGLAEHIVWRYADPKVRPDLVVENWFPTMFQLDLYDVLAVTVAQIGITAKLFEIIGLTHEGFRAVEDGPVHHRVTYQLIESRQQTAGNWFVWDESVWDGSDLLGY